MLLKFNSYRTVYIPTHAIGHIASLSDNIFYNFLIVLYADDITEHLSDHLPIFSIFE